LPPTSASSASAPKNGRILAFIERAGNALPHPATLFAILAAALVVLSGIAAQFDLRVTHPGTGAVVEPLNLMSVPGLHKILTGLVTNFTSFAPLGTVLVALLGIGVAEGSGLIGAVLRLVVFGAPRRLLTFAVVFAGVLSNAASEVGYVVLVPLGAMIFLAVGRHPIAGLAAAFAGVSGGYSANLLLGTIDPLLSGLSQEAAQIVDQSYLVNPACNYYFMAFSTFFIAVAGTWVTEKLVIPRLGEYTGTEQGGDIKPIDSAEKRGLWFALVATLLQTIILLLGTVPANGFLRNPVNGDLLQSPFLSGIVAIIFFVGAISGIAYGIGAGTVRSDEDVVKFMSKTMTTLGGYMVLVFFAAQFVAFFNWTNLGLIFAVKGADVLRSSGLGGIPLMLGFVILTAVVNVFMGSASAKWAIMAPVFVPMFMLLGYAPELTQVAYRVGDSVTNIVSPMMSYFALIVAFVERYQPRAGIGTVVATMLPYSITFLIIWSILLAIWLGAGIPLGPGAPVRIPVG
jgi:aminobenzoyl-glutamate transport protein